MRESRFHLAAVLIALFTMILIVVTPLAAEEAAAAIKPDKTDYATGDPITLTGSGWTAGETVDVVIRGAEATTNQSVVADVNGAFALTNPQLPEGVGFHVQARGLASARTAFALFYIRPAAEPGLGE